MGLGSTAKKIQTVADTAEKLYARMNEMREQVDQLRDTVSTTEERVERVEAELAEQRALVAALAEEQGVDVESVVADATGPEDPDGDEGGEADAAEEASADGEGSTESVDGPAA